MAATKQAKINFHMADESAVAIMRLILSYEAGVRGLSMGQACSELVMEAVDVGSYPAEVRERLAELQAESQHRAVKKALQASRAGDELIDDQGTDA